MLGSDDDLISSKPGDISEDTLDAFGDTVLVYGTPLASDSVLELGRVSGYERTMVMQVAFDGAAGDAAKTVQTAFLRLTASDVDGVFPARFYSLTEPYAQGDSIPSLDTLAVIVDPTSGSPNRNMQTVPRDYALPPALVQGWIRDQIARTAIAVVYNDAATDRIATFKSFENPGASPQLVVNFVGGTTSFYDVEDDATVFRPTTTTPNLVASDGFVRRVYFRIPLDQLEDEAAIHNARVRLHIVPGSVLGGNGNLIVFIPVSPDVTSEEFLSGQLVTAPSFQASSEFIEFGMTNAIALILVGTLENNGVTVRFDAENSELRQVEFYGSSAPDSLRPRIFITSSTPADFDP
jgi:hypothetical protein